MLHDFVSFAVAVVKDGGASHEADTGPQTLRDASATLLGIELMPEQKGQLSISKENKLSFVDQFYALAALWQK